MCLSAHFAGQTTTEPLDLSGTMLKGPQVRE